MQDLLLKLIQSPSADSYLAIRKAVSELPKYSPYSTELNGIFELLDQGRYAEARSRIRTAMPNLIISPRAHWLLAMVATHTGDDKAAEMERVVASCCAEGILATGNGSKEKPYVVLRTSDEYDILEYLGKQFVQQALVNDANRHLDRVQCADGTELWFDITGPFSKLQESLGS